ncbi:HvfC/BufC N-terminal domain-containing protein [Maritalea mediterranea]|uniref:DNA-binding domain-containing protein n=1 Tax=Maritalea mediterranea TaxID=2909667 RepID=A0ABS9EAJ7_9HYPH|nr:DNA-binding domain-containing protein [Maritalea mediterranea]MCF4099912.1 DNA-binding domain-containing protein [Maritalea mediterranea]
MRSPNFRNDQTSFARALFHPDEDGPANLVDPNGAPAPKRFGVYRNNVLVSLIDNLASTFPACQSLVGEEFFRALAREYALNFPPSSPLMIYYGDEFAQFLGNFKPAQQVPFLADIADIEYKRVKSYHAADGGRFDPVTIANLPQQALDSAKLKFHPSFFWSYSRFPAHDIYQRAAVGQTLEGIDFEQPQITLLCRPSWDVATAAIDAKHKAGLTALTAGFSLATSVDIGEKSDPAFDLQDLLTNLLALGAIERFELKNGEQK